MRDITARKQAEVHLRQSEALLKAVIEQMPIAVGLTDKEGKFRTKNDRMDRLARDYTAAIDAETSARWRVFDATGEPVPQSDFSVARVLRGDTARSYEALFRDPDGKETWFQTSAGPLLDEDGAVIGAISVAVDIDERKRAGQALRESEQRIRLAAEATGVGIWEWNLTTNQIGGTLGCSASTASSQPRTGSSIIPFGAPLSCTKNCPGWKNRSADTFNTATSIVTSFISGGGTTASCASFKRSRP